MGTRCTGHESPKSELPGDDMRAERHVRVWINAALLTVPCVSTPVSGQIPVIRPPLGVAVSPIGGAAAPVRSPVAAVRDTNVVYAAERPDVLIRGPALLPVVVPNRPVVPAAEQPEIL